MTTNTCNSAEADRLILLIELQIARCNQIDPKRFKEIRKILRKTSNRYWKSFGVIFDNTYQQTAESRNSYTISPPLTVSPLLEISHRLGKIRKGLIRRKKTKLANNIVQEYRRAFLWCRKTNDLESMNDVLSALRINFLPCPEERIPTCLMPCNGNGPAPSNQLSIAQLSKCSLKRLIAARKTMYIQNKGMRRNRMQTGINKCNQIHDLKEISTTKKTATHHSRAELERFDFQKSKAEQELAKSRLMDYNIDFNVSPEVKSKLFGHDGECHKRLAEKILTQMKDGRPREIIQLFLQGFSKKEICEILLITEANYRQIWSRSLKEIRKMNIY